MYAGNRIGGSNPLASAIKIKKTFRSFFIFICERVRTVGSPGRRSEQKKIYFHFASEEERKDLAKQEPNPLASAKFKK